MTNETDATNQESLLKEALKLQPELVAYAYAKLRDYHLADDVVQEALIVLMKKWSEFEPGTSVYAFVRKIVYYKSLEALRARGRREISLEEEQLDAAVDRALDECMDERAAARQTDLIDALRECLTRLTKKAFELVAAFYRDGKSYKELSNIYSLSIPAIRKALFRARKALQTCTMRKLRQLSAEG